MSMYSLCSLHWTFPGAVDGFLQETIHSPRKCPCTLFVHSIGPTFELHPQKTSKLGKTWPNVATHVWNV